MKPPTRVQATAAVVPDYVEYWSTRIRGAMTKTVESIIEVGNTLAECKEQAEHGQWLPCLQAAGISPRVAQMFMKVAANPILANTTTYSHLPAAYNSLYELTKLDEARLEEVIADGTIGPGTTYSNVKTVVCQEQIAARIHEPGAVMAPFVPYRPEFGPPAPVVYECQDCGRNFDPEPMSDEEAEMAECICPECARVAPPPPPPRPLRGKAKEEAELRAVVDWHAYAMVERDLAWSHLVRGILDPAWLEEHESKLTPEGRDHQATVRDFLKAEALSGYPNFTIASLQVTCWKSYPGKS